MQNMGRRLTNSQSTKLQQKESILELLAPFYREGNPKQLVATEGNGSTTRISKPELNKWLETHKNQVCTNPTMPDDEEK